MGRPGTARWGKAGQGMDTNSKPPYSIAMAKRTPRRRRHNPRKKPQPSFLDAVLDMLSSATGMVAASAGVVLLGRILGEPVRGRIELPAGTPQEIVDEWGRLCGVGVEQGPESSPDPPPAKAKRRAASVKEQPAVELVKGEDGVYRPKENV